MSRGLSIKPLFARFSAVLINLFLQLTGKHIEQSWTNTHIHTHNANESSSLDNVGSINVWTKGFVRQSILFSIFRSFSSKMAKWSEIPSNRIHLELNLISKKETKDPKQPKLKESPRALSSFSSISFFHFHSHLDCVR